MLVYQDPKKDLRFFVLQAAAGGQIALSQASQMIGALATMARLVEVDELAQRITALEERDAKP